jgi:two-component system, NarL family, sensor histidine kinase UhpB
MKNVKRNQEFEAPGLQGFDAFLENFIVEPGLKENLRKIDSMLNNFNGAVFRCRFDRNLTMEYISMGIHELTGYPPTDFLSNRVRSFYSLIHTDDRTRVVKSIKEALRARLFFNLEFRIVSANGEIKWIWGRGTGVFEEDSIVALEGFVSDITDKKNIEEELKSSLAQLHELAQHVDRVREDERLAIARELHDDLGQALTAVKIDLASIKKNVTDMATVLIINRTSALVSDTIKTVQRLTSQLRPQIIDDLGLETAIEWYTKEYEERNKIKIYLDINPGIALSPDTSLVLFRIMQEALTNIARYSKATVARIELGKRAGEVIFSISDNGIGISDEQIHSKRSFGIIGMRERAASLGGTLTIFREEKSSTVVKLVFPLNK